MPASQQSPIIAIDTWKVAVVQKCLQEGEEVNIDQLSLPELAALAVIDYKPMSPHLQPYVEALIRCRSIKSMYGVEKAGHLIPYFLNNARFWRGPVAKATKKELNRRYKEWVDQGEPVETLAD